MTLVLISAIHDAAADRPSGYADEVLSSGTPVTTPDGEFIDVPDEVYDALVAKYSGKKAVRGPGTVLHGALKAIGIDAVPGCQCMKRKAVMDSWGWDECRKPNRIDEVVGWMSEEASARGMFFPATIARAALVVGLAAGAAMYSEGE
jgi:hypothetical protein